MENISAQCFQVPQQHVGHVVAGRLDHDGPDVLGHHGHSVDHTGLLVLADGVGALLRISSRPWAPSWPMPVMMMPTILQRTTSDMD